MLQALGCHLAVMVLYVVLSLDVFESVSICLSLPRRLGRSACGVNLHPLGRSGRGVHAEMLQTLGCHLAVMVVCVVLSLDVLSLQAKKVK